MKKTLLTLLACAAFFSASTLKAEDAVSLSAGVDVVSAYIWRANNYGDAPAIQPWVTASGYGAEFTVWGSQALLKTNEYYGVNEVYKDKYAIKNYNNAYNEIDLIAKYTFNLGCGTLAVSATDFFYPYTGARFFNYKDYDSPTPGAHYINTGIEYNGPETMPLKVIADVCIHNDYNKPVYLELGYKFKIGEASLLPFIGFVKEVGPAASFSTAPTLHTYFLDLNDSPYKINKNRISCVNAGFTVKKSIKVTNDFSLPIEGQLAINPYTEKAYFAFKMSF